MTGLSKENIELHLRIVCIVQTKQLFPAVSKSKSNHNQYYVYILSLVKRTCFTYI